MIHFLLATALPKELTQHDLKNLEVVISRKLKKVKTTAVSLRFVTETVIQRLNKQYRKKNKPTDVLSFGSSGVPGEEEMGDIVIATSYARREAKRRSLSSREELLRLIVHGVLHLDGYDHVTEDEEMKMFALQEELIARVV